MSNTRPVTHAEIRANAEMIRTFSSELLAKYSDSDVVTYYITNVTFNPENVEHLQADMKMVESLVTFPYVFDGYYEAACETPAELLIECYCHFLDGMIDSGRAQEFARIRALFAEIGIDPLTSANE